MPQLCIGDQEIMNAKSETYLGKKKMKLYQFDAAPSSKRVEKFLKETNIKVEIIQLNIMEGEHSESPLKP